MSYTFKPKQILTDVVTKLGGCDTLAEHFSHGYDLSSFVGMDETEVRKIFETEFTETLNQWVDNYLESDDIEVYEFPNPLWMKAAKKSGILE